MTAAMLLASCRLIRLSSSSASASLRGAMPRMKLPLGGWVCGRWSASMPAPNILRLPGMPPTEMPP